jgi:leader peptidase (prepilin peptidase)/N-methyltransferase
VTAYLIGAVWGLVGAAAGVGIRQLSVWLARREDLEPGFKRWQVWGPVLTAAVVFAAFGWRFSDQWLLLGIKSVWAAVLVQVIFFDLEHRLILDRVSYPAYVLAILAAIVTPHPGWLNAIVTGVAAGAILLALAVVGRVMFHGEVLGIGDVKLAVFIGLVLGFPWTLNALLAGILLAGLVSILLLVVRVKTLKDTLAYGPYLAVGALIGLLQRGAG